jgi:hypothetical protein
VLPFLAEMEQQFGDQQFSFAPQIELNDHRPVGVSFKVGDGAPATITTAFGNIVVTRIGDSGTSKGVPFVYGPDIEPYISNSGDLTHEKMAKLVEIGDRYSRQSRRRAKRSSSWRAWTPTSSGG